LSRKTVNLPLLIEQLHVEIPYYRIQIPTSVRAEEADSSFLPLDLEQAIPSVRVLGNCEPRKAFFKIHRKPIVRFVDEQIAGIVFFLVQEIFESVYSRKLKLAE
jgi:hypothetical protein